MLAWELKPYSGAPTSTLTVQTWRPNAVCVAWASWGFGVGFETCCLISVSSVHSPFRRLVTSAQQPRLRLVVPAPPPSAGPSSAVALAEDELLAGLGRRDRNASLAFYDRARPIVDRTLCRLLGAGDPDYEDLAQAALYELVDTIGRFRGECPLDAWLSVVTARVVYRQIRRRRLERRVFAQSPLEEMTPTVACAPVPFASRQAVERIRGHLGRMDTKRAWTFLLHDVYGYALEQIGEIMGTSVSAAQSRLVRGRREIHDRIRVDPELKNFLDDLSEDVP
jgi:RNA polymerase sigma-70 factor (ECF subfamily)